MKLDQLLIDSPHRLAPLAGAPAHLDANPSIEALSADSRHCGPGTLFFAVVGLRVDGHDFAQQAVERGASAVVAERPLGLAVPTLLVDEVAVALGYAAARFCGSPAEALTSIGITGTNGKTTTAYLLEGILKRAGNAPAVIGTVSYRFGAEERPAPFTTPDPLTLQPLLGQMRDAGSTHLVMEVSSHGLQLGRLWGCDFDVAAFSHLSQDHLDLHGTMEAYLAAKALLFSRHLKNQGTAVVNLDGAGSEQIVATVARRPDLHLLRCSREDPCAELRLEQLRCDLSGLSAELVLGEQRLALRSPLLGDYSADNLLLAAGCALAVGTRLKDVVEGATALAGVPGRLERVDNGRSNYAVLVDYAHTPDALRRALATLRPLCPGRLITVFGCGGDRDVGKRALMGEAVGEAADLAVVTSDNPRSEPTERIIGQILPGIERAGLPLVPALAGAPRGYVVAAARSQAIETAVQTLRPGDILLIAGKGHETYQIIGDERLHFDDREQARAALKHKEA